VFDDPGGLGDDSDVPLFDDAVDDAAEHANATITPTPPPVPERVGHPSPPARHRRHSAATSQTTSVRSTRRGRVFRDEIVEESSDDSDDGSYIPSEEEELERDEDEGQDTDAIAEESNNLEGETEAAEEIEEGYEYQNMDEMEGQKRQYTRDLTDLLLRFQGCTAEEHAEEDEESGDSHTTIPAELLTLFE
jgi:hypothetical protein